MRGRGRESVGGKRVGGKREGEEKEKGGERKGMGGKEKEESGWMSESARGKQRWVGDGIHERVCKKKSDHDQGCTMTRAKLVKIHTAA